VTGAGTATPLGVTVVTNVGGLNAVNPGDRDQTTALAPSDGPTAAPAELETQASLKMVLVSIYSRDSSRSYRVLQ